jgi:general secretion pathway protein J
VRPFPRHRSGGFTLVELLLATALLSILLGLAYSGLRSSIRAADRGQVILEESNRLRMSHQFVHRQLNQMLPLGFAQSEADNSFTVFQGSRQFARYVSPMPGYLGFGGPQVQELALVPSETSDGKALVLNHALLQGFEETDLYQSEPILLIDGISDAEFLFQGVEDGELTGWIADWEEESTVPKAVSLSIEFEEGSYVIWPLLTAIVRIDNMAVRLSGAQKSAYSANMDRLLNRDKKN